MWRVTQQDVQQIWCWDNCATIQDCSEWIGPPKGHTDLRGIKPMYLQNSLQEMWQSVRGRNRQKSRYKVEWTQKRSGDKGHTKIHKKKQVICRYTAKQVRDYWSRFARKPRHQLAGCQSYRSWTWPWYSMDQGGCGDTQDEDTGYEQRHWFIFPITGLRLHSSPELTWHYPEKSRLIFEKGNSGCRNVNQTIIRFETVNFCVITLILCYILQV